VYYFYDGQEYIYHIYENGTITTTNGTFVTNGGIQSLLVYIKTTIVTTSYKITYTINGVNTTFTIEKGVVIDDKGKVICQTGGEICL